MDFIRELGPLVLDHRCRRMMETLLRTAEEIYEARGLHFRARWTSTYLLLDAEGPLPVTDIAQRIRLTHPGVIGITDEMRDAGWVTAVRDRDDARRRLIGLTKAAKRQKSVLRKIWNELAAAQRERFAAAGCDIVAVLNTVDDGLAQRSLTAEVLQRLAEPGRTARQKGARTSLLAVALTLAMHSALPAQESRTPVREQRASVVQAISEQLVARYIYERTARTMSDSLQARLRAGAFDRLGDAEFADSVTRLFFRISNDRHLGLHVDRRAPDSAQATPQTVRRRPAAPATRQDSLGFHAAEILRANIGYLDVRGFSDAPEALDYADSVMTSFANVKALVIDLRQNRGGGPEMVRLLSTYLFDKPTHLVSTFMRGMSAPMERWTLDRVRGARLARQPVYVLTSRRTISAAESFTFGLKIHQRVTIVGEPTGGGGHFGEFVTLPGGFRMFLPRGRTFDPRTNLGWEATGIQPDVSVPAGEALTKALELIGQR